MTEVYINSFTVILVALIAGIPVTLGAYWGYKANKNSQVAVVNSADAKQNSADAKKHSEEAIHELKANGGMLEPNPTLNDKINYVIEIAEADNRRLDSVVVLLESHLKHAAVMDGVLADVYHYVMPKPKEPKTKP